jgi:hypothetical protein
MEQAARTTRRFRTLPRTAAAAADPAVGPVTLRAAAKRFSSARAHVACLSAVLSVPPPRAVALVSASLRRVPRFEGLPIIQKFALCFRCG